MIMRAVNGVLDRADQHGGWTPSFGGALIGGSIPWLLLGGGGPGRPPPPGWCRHLPGGDLAALPPMSAP
jgi:hypothetical protein